MKAHELARELGISQKELVNFLQQRRLTRNAAAPLAPGAIEAARSAFKPTTAAPRIETNGNRQVVLPPTLSVKDLADKLGVSPVEVIKKLMASKILAKGMGLSPDESRTRVESLFDLGLPSAWGPIEALREASGLSKPMIPRQRVI